MKKVMLSLGGGALVGMLLINTCSALDLKPIERFAQDYPNQEISIPYAGQFDDDWYALGQEAIWNIKYNKGWNKDLTFRYENGVYSLPSTNIIVEDSTGESLTRSVAFYQVSPTLTPEQENSLASIGVESYFNEYYIRDLEVVNMMLSNESEQLWTRIPTKHRFSGEIRQLLNSNSIDLVWFGQGGGPYTDAQEAFSAGYEVIDDGVIIGTVGINMVSDNVMYIPEDTADDNESIAEAIKNRIIDYVGEENEVTVTPANEITIFDFSSPDFTFDAPFEHTKNTQSYTICIGEKEWLAYAEKNNEKISTPALDLKDDDIGTEVATESSEVPLDATNDTSDFSEATDEELVNIGSNYGEKFDIKLYSHALGRYIEGIRNGFFEVSLPISDRLKNKKLAVYYVDARGNKERYEVEIRNGKAVFKTKHFSEYILAEDSGEDAQNPDSQDNIVYTVVAMVAMATIACVAYSKRK